MKTIIELREEAIEKDINPECYLYQKLEKLSLALESAEQRIDKAIEYIEKNTLWFDDELGLVEMEGYNSNRIPVIRKCYLLNILKGSEE